MGSSMEKEWLLSKWFFHKNDYHLCSTILRVSISSPTNIVKKPHFLWWIAVESVCKASVSVLLHGVVNDTDGEHRPSAVHWAECFTCIIMLNLFHLPYVSLILIFPHCMERLRHRAPKWHDWPQNPYLLNPKSQLLTTVQHLLPRCSQ